MSGALGVAADGVGEGGVHEGGVLEALSAAGRGAGDVVGALLVQVEAQVLQVRVLPQEIALSATRELNVFNKVFSRVFFLSIEIILAFRQVKLVILSIFLVLRHHYADGVMDIYQ